VNRLRLVFQLALAALIACAGGALILVLLLTLAAVAWGLLSGADAGEMAAAAPTLLAMAVIGGGLAMGPVVVMAWPPVFVAGAVLWTAGRAPGWRRSRLAWGLAGAVPALLCYLRAFASNAPDPSLFSFFRLPSAALAAAFLLAGAAAGQVYRSAMAATAPFFGFEEDPDEA